jgi:hypothetical protein
MILCMWEALLTPGLIGKMAFDKDDNIAMRYAHYHDTTSAIFIRYVYI